MAALIDDWLPDFDHVERHETTVAADARHTYHHLRAADLAASPVVRVLLMLRGMPPRATLDDLLGFGFVLLDERDGEEIVFGLVGAFWRPTGGIQRTTASAFREADVPGYAKTAWNFRVTDLGGGRCRLATETRVRCGDPQTARSFRRYWTVIRPFSGLIRRLMLRTIRAEAERTSPQR